MYCVFYVSEDKNVLLDFFKEEVSARRYMDSLKHLKLSGEFVLDFVPFDGIKSYINQVFSTKE